MIFTRDISGRAAIRLGEGDPYGLSPDRRWALALFDGSLTLPTGAGSVRVLDRGKLAGMQLGRWSPDGKHIVFAGWEGAEELGERIYVQAIDGGAPRPITPAGVSVIPRIVTPDGRAVIGISFRETAARLYPIDGGSPRPFPALTSRDVPIQWSADGATIYATPVTGSPWGTSTAVFRIDVATGRRSVWKTLAPADPVGVDLVGPVVMTPDAKAYCYSYMRRLGSLFTIDGLR